jgi:hypothetical protein
MNLRLFAKNDARGCQPGDIVHTNYSREWTEHRIRERIEGQRSQSGILFKLDPDVPRSGDDQWLDADWFNRGPLPVKSDAEA